MINSNISQPERSRSWSRLIDATSMGHMNKRRDMADIPYPLCSLKWFVIRSNIIARMKIPKQGR